MSEETPEEGSGASALQALLRQSFDQAPGLVALLAGAELRFAYANPAYLALIGREVLGLPIREALPELAAQGFADVLDRVFETGEPFVAQGAELRLPWRDGSEEPRYFDFVYQPLRDPEGRIEGVFGQGTDVTDRVRAEAALRASEARYGAIIQQIEVGIAQCDLTGRFLLVNACMAEILGRSEAQILGQTMQSFTHPDDLAQNQPLFRRLAETGEPFVIEKRYLRPDGAVVWVRNHVSPVRDAQGRPQSATAVVIDISAEKQAQADLRRSEALSAAVLDAALDSIVTISADNRVLEWNAAAEATFGLPRQEAMGRDLGELIIPPEHRAAHAAGMRRYLETGRGRSIGRRVEVEALRRDGTRIPVELTVAPIFIEGRTLFTSYLRDITEQRRWAERQRLLINELNHRVKNTLATVQSLAQTARRSADPQVGYEAFLDRLTALSRAHDVLTRQQWEGADLGEIVQGAVLLFAGAEADRFSISGPPVWLAPHQALALAMALHELATNAAKYGALSNLEGRVRLAWSVTGAGAERRLVLEWREAQGPTVTIPRRKGFGSRLLERGLARELGGRVQMDFRPHGLVCTIEAPLLEPAPEAEAVSL